VAVVGGSYAKTAELLFVQKTDGSDTVLAVATGSAQWWPFIVICVVISGIIGLILVELRLSKQRGAKEPDKLLEDKPVAEKNSQDYMPAEPEPKKVEHHDQPEK